MDTNTKTATAQKNSERVGEEIPRLLTKKFLCCYFGLFSGSRPVYSTLYSKVLTNDVLEKAGMTQEQIRKRGFRFFDAQQSERLRAILFPVALLFAIAGFAQRPVVDSTLFHLQVDIPETDTIFRRDTLYGMAMVRDTLLAVTETSGGDKYLHAVEAPTIIDLYSVTDWIEIVDPKFGYRHAVIRAIRYFKTTDCTPVPYRRVLYFKTN